MEGKVTTDVTHKVLNQMPNSPPIVKHVFHMIFDPYVGDKGLLMMVLENKIGRAHV